MLKYIPQGRENSTAHQERETQTNTTSLQRHRAQMNLPWSPAIQNTGKAECNRQRLPRVRQRDVKTKKEWRQQCRHVNWEHFESHHTNAHLNLFCNSPVTLDRRPVGPPWCASCWTCSEAADQTWRGPQRSLDPHSHPLTVLLGSLGWSYYAYISIRFF